MNLRIERAETIDFLDWCRRTISQRSHQDSIRPYDGTRVALVFSFDIEMQLFLGNSYGWNRREQRTYFPRTPVVMDRIGQTMLPHREVGGRVFVDNRKAYYIHLASQERKLCNLIWPKGTDVVSDVRDFWLALPRRSHMTLRLPESRRRVST